MTTTLPGSTGVFHPAKPAMNRLAVIGVPADGATITITDGGSVSEVFEFNSDGNFPENGGTIEVLLFGGATQAQVVQLLCNAINANSTLVKAIMNVQTADSSYFIWLYTPAGEAYNGCTLATSDSGSFLVGASTFWNGSDDDTIYPAVFDYTLKSTDANGLLQCFVTQFSHIERWSLNYVDDGKVANMGQKATPVDRPGASYVLFDHHGATAPAENDKIQLTIWGKF